MEELGNRRTSYLVAADTRTDSSFATDHSAAEDAVDSRYEIPEIPLSERRVATDLEQAVVEYGLIERGGQGGFKVVLPPSIGFKNPYGLLCYFVISMLDTHSSHVVQDVLEQIAEWGKDVQNDEAFNAFTIKLQTRMKEAVKVADRFGAPNLGELKLLEEFINRKVAKPPSGPRWGNALETPLYQRTILEADNDSHKVTQAWQKAAQLGVAELDDVKNWRVILPPPLDTPATADPYAALCDIVMAMFTSHDIEGATAVVGQMWEQRSKLPPHDRQFFACMDLIRDRMSHAVYSAKKKETYTPAMGVLQKSMDRIVEELTRKYRRSPLYLQSQVEDRNLRPLTDDDFDACFDKLSPIDKRTEGAVYKLRDVVLELRKTSDADENLYVEAAALLQWHEEGICTVSHLHPLYAKAQAYLSGICEWQIRSVCAACEEFMKAVESSVLHGGSLRKDLQNQRLNFQWMDAYTQGIAKFDEKNKKWLLILPPPKEADFEDTYRILTNIAKEMLSYGDVEGAVALAKEILSKRKKVMAASPHDRQFYDCLVILRDTVFGNGIGVAKRSGEVGKRIAKMETLQKILDAACKNLKKKYDKALPIIIIRPVWVGEPVFAGEISSSTSRKEAANLERGLFASWIRRLGHIPVTQKEIQAMEAASSIFGGSTSELEKEAIVEAFESILEKVGSFNQLSDLASLYQAVTLQSASAFRQVLLKALLKWPEPLSEEQIGKFLMHFRHLLDENITLYGQGVAKGVLQFKKNIAHAINTRNSVGLQMRIGDASKGELSGLLLHAKTEIVEAAKRIAIDLLKQQQ